MRLVCRHDGESFVKGRLPFLKSSRFIHPTTQAHQRLVTVFSLSAAKQILRRGNASQSGRPRPVFHLGDEARAKHVAEIKRQLEACSGSHPVVGAAERPITLDMVDSALHPSAPVNMAAHLVERLEGNAATGSIYSINYRHLLRSITQVQGWKSVPFLPDFVGDDGTLCVTRIRAQIMAGVDEPLPKRRKAVENDADPETSGLGGAAAHPTTAAPAAATLSPATAAAASASMAPTLHSVSSALEHVKETVEHATQSVTPTVNYFFLSGTPGDQRPTPAPPQEARPQTSQSERERNTSRLAVEETEQLLALLEGGGARAISEPKNADQAVGQTAQAPHEHNREPLIQQQLPGALSKAEAAEVRCLEEEGYEFGCRGHRRDFVLVFAFPKKNPSPPTPVSALQACTSAAL